MITSTCPSCGHEITVDDKYAGQQGQCGKCRAEVTAPAAFLPRRRFTFIWPFIALGVLSAALLAAVLSWQAQQKAEEVRLVALLEDRLTKQQAQKVVIDHAVRIEEPEEKEPEFTSAKAIEGATSDEEGGAWIPLYQWEDDEPLRTDAISISPHAKDVRIRSRFSPVFGGGENYFEVVLYPEDEPPHTSS